jgi:peptidoglycan/xylan/chitin deacetylase (PgdA/CDA1 family)
MRNLHARTLWKQTPGMGLQGVDRGVPMQILPQNLIMNPGTIIEDFEDAASWTVSSSPAGGTATNDTVNFKTGSRGLKLTTPGSVGNITVTKVYDFITDGNIRFWVYCADSSLPYDVNIMLSNSPTLWTNYFQCFRNVGGHIYRNAPGWNLISIRSTDWAVGGGTPSFASPIRQIRIRVNTDATAHAYTFDSFTIGQVSQGAVVLTFDDGVASQYDVAFSYLRQQRARATVFPISSLVGGLGYLTWAKLQEMYAHGWTVANHTSTTTNLTTLTEAQQETTINTCDAALLANGIVERRKYLAFPGGNYNADTLIAMTATGMRFGRMVANWTEKMPIANTSLIPGRGIGSSVSLATAQGYIDTAKNRQEIAILYFHGISDTPGAGDWYADRFRSLVDYAITQGVPIITIDDLYNLQTRSISIPMAI